MYDNEFDIFGSYLMSRGEFEDPNELLPGPKVLRYQTAGFDRSIFMLGAHLYQEANASFIRQLFHFWTVLATAAVYIVIKLLKIRFHRRRLLASWSFWLVFGGLCSVFANVLTVFIASGPVLVPPFKDMADMERAVRSGRCALLFPYGNDTGNHKRMMKASPPTFVHWDEYQVIEITQPAAFLAALQDRTQVRDLSLTASAPRKSKAFLVPHRCGVLHCQTDVGGNALRWRGPLRQHRRADGA